MRREQRAEQIAQRISNVALCPRPDKRAFYSKAETKRWIKRKMSNGSFPDAKYLWAYLCPCGLFHVGNR